MKKKKENPKIGVGFGVMLLKNKKILLGRRHEEPNKADSVFRVSDVWTMPGGKLNYGESFKEGAIREVLEETGIRLNNAKILCINEDRNEHAHFITIGLLSTDFKGEAQVLEPDEITKWKWFSSKDLPKNIYFPSLKVLKNFKAKKFHLDQN